MKDCCEDKTSPYDIRPEDAVLVDAAIKFGERLSSFAETTQEQKGAISQMLTFLRNLPEPPPLGLHGEFGFRIEAEDETIDGGHCGIWCVSVCRAMFEMFNCGRENLAELSWLLCPGHKNANSMTHAGAWAVQVGDPRALLLPGQHLVVDASTWNVKE